MGSEHVDSSRGIQQVGILALGKLGHAEVGVVAAEAYAADTVRASHTAVDATHWATSMRALQVTAVPGRGDSVAT